MEWIQLHYQDILSVIGALYALALVIVKLTPTPADNAGLDKVNVILQIIGKLFGLDLTQGINTKPAVDLKGPPVKP